MNIKKISKFAVFELLAQAYNFTLFLHEIVSDEWHQYEYRGVS